MKRIAFFQSDLGVGGIQKSIVNLLRNLDYSRYQVDLYLSEKTDFWTDKFPPELNIRTLRPISRIWSFLPFDLAKRQIRYEFPPDVTYDLAVDFNSYQCSCAVGALTVPAKKRVMWVHNDVGIKLENEWKYRVLWHFFRGKFRYYDGFVTVSRALIEPFRKASGVGGKFFKTIPNFIDVGEIRQKALETPPNFALEEGCLNVVALGRLCHQKGYDIMLDTFADALKRRPELRLYIIGDGPDRAALEQQRDRLGLKDKAHFLGNQPNPFQYMARMDAFLSTSRYEGQGMNIMEAMVLGLPVYCPRHLEQYIDGLQGCDDLVSALAAAQKQEKRPDDLREYNGRILEAFSKLTEE